MKSFSKIGIGLVVAGLAVAGLAHRAGAAQGEPTSLSAAAKLQSARLLLAKAGKRFNLSRIASTLSWGLKDASNSAQGELTMGPGVEKVNLKHGRVELAVGGATGTDHPLNLNVTPAANSIYLVDVHVTINGATSKGNFFADTKSLSTGTDGDIGKHSSLITNTNRHFQFILQTKAPVNGKARMYQIKIGADERWSFHRLEMSRLE